MDNDDNDGNDREENSSPVDSLLQAKAAIKLRRSQQAEDEDTTKSVERIPNEASKMGMLVGTQNTTSTLDAKAEIKRMKNSQPSANEDAASQDFSVSTRGSTPTSILEAKAAIKLRRSDTTTTSNDNQSRPSSSAPPPPSVEAQTRRVSQVSVLSTEDDLTSEDLGRERPRDILEAKRVIRDSNTKSQLGFRQEDEEEQDQDIPEELENVDNDGYSSESGRGVLIAAELVNVEQAEVIDLNSLVAASTQPKTILLVSLLLLVIMLITVGGICGSGLCSRKESTENGREELNVGCMDANREPLSNCTCHESCASCGYYHKPVTDVDCITCQEGLDLTLVYPDGAGICGRSDSQDYPCIVPLHRTFDCFFLTDSCSSCTQGRSSYSFVDQDCGSLEEDLFEVTSCCPVCANATETLLQCLDAKPNQTICN